MLLVAQPDADFVPFYPVSVKAISLLWQPHLPANLPYSSARKSILGSELIWARKAQLRRPKILAFGLKSQMQEKILAKMWRTPGQAPLRDAAVSVYILELKDAYVLELIILVTLLRNWLVITWQRLCHLPVQTPIPNPAPRPELLPSFTGLFTIVPCDLTPATIRSKLVSITTPPLIISPNVACSVSKLKMRSSSHTFSKSLSRAST